MRFVVVLCCFIFVACSEGSKVPAGIIPQDKMQAILWDMLQADRFATQFLNDSLKRALDIQRFAQYHTVFAIHNIEKKEFFESFNYYLSRPDITRTIFDSLTQHANRLRPTLYQESSPAVQ